MEINYSSKKAIRVGWSGDRDSSRAQTKQKTSVIFFAFILRRHIRSRGVVDTNVVKEP